MAGTEALNGLLLIGWSACHVHIAMDRFLKQGATAATAFAGATPDGPVPIEADSRGRRRSVMPQPIPGLQPEPRRVVASDIAHRDVLVPALDTVHVGEGALRSREALRAPVASA